MAAPLTNEIVDQRIAGRPIVRLSDYGNAYTRVLWGCTVPGCGTEWRSVFNDIRRGHGCPTCGKKSMANTQRFTNEIVDQRTAGRLLRRVGEYVNSNTRVLWECLAPDCGHKWLALLLNVERGSGCPSCAVTGFNPNKPAILYYLRVGSLYKIGITNLTVAKRYPCDMRQIHIVQQWHYAKGADAYKREQNILKWFAEDRYTGPPVMAINGNTELFTRDILQLEAA